jgi:hypothetical protein
MVESHHIEHRWIDVRSDSLCGIFSGAIGAYLVYGHRSITTTVGDIGFTLNQIMVSPRYFYIMTVEKYDIYFVHLLFCARTISFSLPRNSDTRKSQ